MQTDELLTVGVTDTGEVVIELPGSPPLYLEPTAARAMAGALVVCAADADRVRAGAN